MGRRLGVVAIAALGASFAIHIGGCSLIGVGMGTNADAHKPPIERLQPGLMRIDPGARITVLLDDSTQAAGVYRGPQRMPDAEYRALYDAWRAVYSRGASFPAIGERVEQSWGGRGEFVAFSAEGIEIRPGRWDPEVTGLDRLGWIVRPSGERLDLREARDLAIAGDLPMATALRLQTRSGERVVPIHRVALVEVVNNRHAARNGFIAGLVVDAIIIHLLTRPDGLPASCQGYSHSMTGWSSRGRLGPTPIRAAPASAGPSGSPAGRRRRTRARPGTRARPPVARPGG